MPSILQFNEELVESLVSESDSEFRNLVSYLFGCYVSCTSRSTFIPISDKILTCALHRPTPVELSPDAVASYVVLKYCNTIPSQLSNLIKNTFVLCGKDKHAHALAFVHLLTLLPPTTHIVSTVLKCISDEGLSASEIASATFSFNDNSMSEKSPALKEGGKKNNERRRVDTSLELLVTQSSHMIHLHKEMQNINWPLPLEGKFFFFFKKKVLLIL